MIVLNYPNNPTGKIIAKPTYHLLLQRAKQHDLYVLSDEIYSNYTFSGLMDMSIRDYEKTIITQSFSKSHAMTGYRIGWVVAETSIIEKMSKLQALSLTNVSEPIQYAALGALGADTSKNTEIIKSRLETLVKIAKDIGLEFIEPEGAMYLFAKTNTRILTRQNFLKNC